MLYYWNGLHFEACHRRSTGLYRCPLKCRLKVWSRFWRADAVLSSMANDLAEYRTSAATDSCISSYSQRWVQRRRNQLNQQTRIERGPAPNLRKTAFASNIVTWSWDIPGPVMRYSRPITKPSAEASGRMWQWRQLFTRITGAGRSRKYMPRIFAMLIIYDVLSSKQNEVQICKGNKSIVPYCKISILGHLQPARNQIYGLISWSRRESTYFIQAH